MTPAQFQSAALDILKNYWRIKAAIAFYRSSTVPDNCLEYANVPVVGAAANYFTSESVSNALAALQAYIARRLPRDLFLATIAEFESRLITRLVSLGDSGEGTLGQLQSRIERLLPVPAALSEDLNEVRERRNAIIHHADLADDKYIAVSAAVLPRAAPYVKATAVGDNVSPTEIYVTYSADVLVRYSNAVG